MKTGLRTGYLIASLCLGTVMACAQSSPGVAIVNGETITEEQVHKEAATELSRLDQKRDQFLATLERDKKKAVEEALTEIVSGKMLAAEAKKRSVTIDELINQEVKAKVTKPSEETVRKFYEDNKARIKGTFIETALDISNYLMEEENDRMFAAFLAKLRKDYGFRSMIEPARTTVATQGHPSKGPANAPVTIVEFSDFECPFCNGIIPTLKALEANYKDKIRVVYRQFPLNNIHPRAQKAAEASLCAHEQGKFWEFHDAMFADQQRLTMDDLKAKAAALAMNGPAFAACVESGKHAAAVGDSIAEGSKAGVDGTPALFINGRFLAGAQPYAEIEKSSTTNWRD